jgi:hypothetical protein
MRLTLALITGLLLSVNASAVTLTFEDVPEAIVEDIKNVVMVKIIRHEKATADIYDTAKKEALDTRVEAIREKYFPTPKEEEPVEEVKDPVEDISEESVNWG